MNLQSKLSTIHKSVFLRMGIGLMVMLLGLTFINIAKLYRFTPMTYTIYVLPFVLYFCGLYVCFRIAMEKGRFFVFLWFLLLLAASQSYNFVRYYYYDLVPIFIDGFTSEWQPEHRSKLLAKVYSGLLFFAALFIADYLGWAYFYSHTLFKKVQYQLNNLSDVQLLSGHFVRRLYNIVRGQSKTVQSKSLNFFQYVTDKIANPTVLVPLKEEWHYLILLVAYSTDRNFRIEGEELLDKQAWNRSLPTLSIMTWIENAVAYSPNDPLETIHIKWTKEAQGLQLQIKNCIAAGDVQKGTGKGLQLVSRLFESMKSQFVQLEYAVEDQKYFVIKLTFYT